MADLRWTSKLRCSTALGLVIACASTVALGDPTGGVVINGDTTITSPDATTTLIEQSTQRGIIEWNTFDVAPDEQVIFRQPGAEAITLNRVTGGHGPSAIHGRLDANGRIIITNGDGIVFGDGAEIDVGALIATTADIANDTFMNGELEFNIPGSPDGSVINHGNITARDGGLIALVAPHAENSGVLSARVGRVAVAGGDRFTVDFSGSAFLQLAVDPDSAAGQYLASNSGRIAAEGGHVLLTAQTASDALTGVVNNSGVVEATGVDTSGGRIRLLAGGGTVARNSGTLRARGSTGGTIEVTAERVVLTDTSVIDASGTHGGGTVRVGGDYLGGNDALASLNPLAPPLADYSIYSAHSTIAETGSIIRADALDAGDGGQVILWSDHYTITDAIISARGGLSFGNGGFVETSGGVLDVRQAADVSAPSGISGTWLLDPYDIEIVEGLVTEDVNVTGDFVSPTGASSRIGADLINLALSFGNTVIISNLGSGGPDDGDITISADIQKPSGPDAELQIYAEDDIIIRPGVNITSESNELTVVLSANDQIRAGSMGRLETNGGDLNLVSGDDIELDTDSLMPNVFIYDIPSQAPSRVDVELDFADDHIEFQYTSDEIIIPTGGFELVERNAGFFTVAFFGDRTVILNDRAFLLQDGRDSSFEFLGAASYGASEDDALNGIPEVINYPNVASAPFGDNPPDGVVPVVEVSVDEGLTVDALVAASPDGVDIIADLGNPDPDPDPDPDTETDADPEPSGDSVNPSPSGATAQSTPAFQPKFFSESERRVIEILREFGVGQLTEEAANALSRELILALWRQGSLPYWGDQINDIAIAGMLEARVSQIVGDSLFNFSTDIAIGILSNAIVQAVDELMSQSGYSALARGVVSYSLSASLDVAIFTFLHPEFASRSFGLVVATSLISNTVSTSVDLGVEVIDFQGFHNEIRGNINSLRLAADEAFSLGIEARARGDALEARRLFELSVSLGDQARLMNESYPYQTVLEALAANVF
ncbi:MAG: filamentous hemagglutinin N-terminal domain-containing protein [Roseicyclus sp.]|nr:filamentous hemagglutinin N-terminal domain-containing protein [Roseicyclus sp.]